MAEVILRFDVDISDAERHLKRLEDPPVIALEGVLAYTFGITQARVHVITGHLKASGHPTSEYARDVWSGTINYDRYPGIYELARGPAITRHHSPPDTHFFFDPVEAPVMGPYDTMEGEAVKLYERVIMDWIERA